MLAVLLESRAARPHHVGGTILSTLVHSAVIVTVVALTLPGRGNAKPGPDISVDTVRFVRPTPPAPDAPAPARANASSPNDAPPRPDVPVIDVPSITPNRIPSIDPSLPTTFDEAILIGRRSRAFGSGASEPGTPVGSAGGVSDVGAVDRAPRLLGRAIEPRYPATLRSAGVEGRVLAEFVVDTLGRAELGTLRFPELASPLFGDAVRDALARYRFVPGEIAGRKVRTRVAVPFEFRLTK